MKKKLLAYAFLPVLGLGVASANVASAQGLFYTNTPVSATELATRQKSMFQEEADLLGVSVADVTEAWANGKNYLELAKEKGISQEQIQAKLKDLATAKMKEQLSMLVSQGVITQAQADRRLATMQSKMPQGGRRMMRGMMNRGL